MEIQDVNVMLLLKGRNDAQVELTQARDTPTIQRLCRKRDAHETALRRAGMYLYQTTDRKVTGPEYIQRAARQRPPFGPGLTAEKALEAVRIEIWSTRFGRTGKDFNVFCVFNSSGKMFTSFKVVGH